MRREQLQKLSDTFMCYVVEVAVMYYALKTEKSNVRKWHFLLLMPFKKHLLKKIWTEQPIRNPLE